jgi:hypothetical protein
LVLTPVEGTYEFAEALYLLANIHLKEKDAEKFKSVYTNLEKRFGPQHELIGNLYQEIISKGLLWLLL